MEFLQAYKTSCTSPLSPYRLSFLSQLPVVDCELLGMVCGVTPVYPIECLLHKWCEKSSNSPWNLLLLHRQILAQFLVGTTQPPSLETEMRHDCSRMKRSEGIIIRGKGKGGKRDFGLWLSGYSQSNIRVIYHLQLFIMLKRFTVTAERQEPGWSAWNNCELQRTGIELLMGTIMISCLMEILSKMLWL